MKKLLFGVLACLLWSVVTLAQDAGLLKPGHPEEYVVVKGDTLWDIAGRFLNQPWLWPEIWQANPQIQNPHLIYPGDQLSLIYVDGKPRLALTRGSGDVKLEPEVRSSALDLAIPAIPLEEINAFLSRSRIVTDAELEAAPYVLAGASGHVITGAGDKLYARGTFPEGEHGFGVFRRGDVYVDPVTGEYLGTQAQGIGTGRLVSQENDIGTLLLNSSNQEVRTGDRLLPFLELKISATFFPSAPKSDVKGVIVAVEGGVTQIGYLDIVVLNRGTREGIEAGNVFAVSRVGESVPDPITNKYVQLPDARAGLLMVFRSFEKMSLGLVLNANQPLKVGDKISAP